MDGMQVRQSMQVETQTGPERRFVAGWDVDTRRESVTAIPETRCGEEVFYTVDGRAHVVVVASPRNQVSSEHLPHPMDGWDC